MNPTTDGLGRPLRDLRVSVTDRCNLRCPYCMPADVFGPEYAFVPREEILTFEEITRIVRIFTDLGVRKVRLTGGEPLLRRGLPELVAALSQVARIEDLALTTNGLLLAAFAQELRNAGLQRVTVSLDALDNDVFQKMSGSRRGVTDVLEGMATARAAGLPVKVNCVLQRGVNDGQIRPLAHFCREEGHELRFIEFMDVGNHNSWNAKSVITSREVRNFLEAEFGLEPLPCRYPGEVAGRWRYRDGKGEVGFISSVTEPFCAGCNRGRLTADGRFVTCLFAESGTDLKTKVRNGADDAELAAFLRAVWHGRTDRYSELRSTAGGVPAPRVEMSYVGG